MATRRTWKQNVPSSSILNTKLNMNSSTNSSSSSLKILSTDPNTMFPATKSPSSRTLSFSSLSSLSSSSSSSLYFDDDSPISPVTPLGLISAVPFSWEQIPGIPKKQRSIRKKDSAANIILPLPPQGSSSTPKSSKRVDYVESGSRRKSVSLSRTPQRDPFFAALIECSKDDQDVSRNSWARDKVVKNINDRLGFVNLSCKNTCGVAESVVYLPRSRRASCDLTSRRLI